MSRRPKVVLTARELHEKLTALMPAPPPPIKEILTWTQKSRAGAQRWVEGVLAYQHGRALRPPPARRWMTAPPPSAALPSIPTCAVREVVEATGPKGGTIHVLTLACGAWATRRLGRQQRPPAAIPCVSCFLRQRAVTT